MQDLIEKATSETNTHEDWGTIIEICERADRSEGSTDAREIVQFLIKRLQHKNVNVILYTLTVANSLVQNCGISVKREISSRAFMDALVNLLNKRVHVTVKNRILELVRAWAQEFKDDESLGFVVDTFNQLKQEYTFPSLDQVKSPSSDKTREEEEFQLALALSLSQQQAQQNPTSTNSRQNDKVLFSVRALYDFNATEEGELRLRAGDVIKVYDCTTFPDWWMGSVGGQIGIFPANYVQKISSTAVEPVATPVVDQDTALLNQMAKVNRLRHDISKADPLGHNPSENEKLLRDYQAILELRPKVISAAENTRKVQDDLTILNHRFTAACSTYQKLMDHYGQQYAQVEQAQYYTPGQAQYQQAPPQYYDPNFPQQRY